MSHFSHPARVPLFLIATILVPACTSSYGPYGASSSGLIESRGDHYGAGPCSWTQSVMEGSQGLISWASNKGAGVEHRHAQVRATDGAYSRGDFDCQAKNSGNSYQLGGEILPYESMEQSQFLMRERPYRLQHYRQDYYGR